MMRSSPGWLGCVVLPLVVGCAQDTAARRHELAEISAHHTQELTEFQRAQADFARNNVTPRQIDFPGHGTILLHECALDGRPARAELWLRYTWVNTTDHAVDEVVVTITVEDPADQNAYRSTEMPLRLPLKFRFSPDSSYTTSIGLPTDGLHLRPGWKWEIRPRTSTSPDSAR